MRTPEELERLAYITGDTKTADLLAQVIDRDDEIQELTEEIDYLQDALYERNN